MLRTRITGGCFSANQVDLLASVVRGSSLSAKCYEDKADQFGEITTRRDM